MTYLVKSSVLILAVSAAGFASAQDGSLYEPAPDPNMSYVRVIDPGSDTATVASQPLDEIGPGISAYVGVPAGEVPVQSDGIETTVSVEPATYYTVFSAADGTPTIAIDANTNSPAKADLAFYNKTDIEGVELFVPQANAAAVSDVAPWSSASVALNAPLVVDFELRDQGGEVLATLSGVSLKRKSGVSIVLTGSDGAYEAITTDNSFVY